LDIWGLPSSDFACLFVPNKFDGFAAKAIDKQTFQKCKNWI